MKILKLTQRYQYELAIKVVHEYEKTSNDKPVKGWNQGLLGKRLQYPVYFYKTNNPDYNNLPEFRHPDWDTDGAMETIIQYDSTLGMFIAVFCIN